MAFYWGQGIGLPRNPPAFLLLPNTLKGLRPCEFWFMCCFGFAPPGKPNPDSPFSFSQSQSAYHKCSLHREQTAQTADGQKLWRTEKESQRERQAERKIHKASKCKKCLWLEQTKPFCSYANSRSQRTTFCWGTRGMRVIFSFIQFLISPLRLKLSFCCSICLKLLFCKTSN